MSRETRLDELLLLWESLRRKGESIDVEGLCADCPDLLDDLREHIRLLDVVGDHLGSTTPSTAEPETQPAGPALLPRELGRYRLEQKIGEGGFGQVWRAFDPVLGRPVAIKVPRPDRTRSAHQTEQFLREARKLAGLEHPGIVPVYDAGQSEPFWYIVSKLITGGDLATWLMTNRAALPLAARLTAEAARALHFAHQRGFVHRDIKPANILLDAPDKPLLADFGLAVTAEERLRERAGIRGTLSYMAPEQARGDSRGVDERSDVYSLGVVLYELLTGYRPFAASEFNDLRKLILEQSPPSPRLRVPELPEEVERICLRCLAKAPAERYASAAELARELRRFEASSSSQDITSPLPGQEEPPSPCSLSFGIELTRLRESFVGREWLDAEVERWLASPVGRLFLVTGDPGAGKSAYLAHLVETFSQVAAHHFCIAGLAESLDPHRFVTSLSAQLARRVPGFRLAPGAAPEGPVSQADAGTLWRHLVATPLRATTEPVLIVIDGLDEALTIGERNIARLLADRLDDLPATVRVVASTRKDPAVLDLFTRTRPFEIEVGRPENLRDVAGYIDARLSEPDLRELLDRADVRKETVAEVIARKAAGNFLYVTQALEALRNGQIDPTRPETFPEGLVGIYQGYFERIFPQRQGYDAFRPLLDVIAAAREPLSAEQVASFLDRDAFDVENDLQRVAVMLPECDGRFWPCHKSLTDWLCGLAGKSKTYRVNVAAGHRHIAARLLSDFRAGGRTPFLLAHLPTHLTQSGRWDDLEAVLTDLSFIQAKCAAGLTFALVQDYNAALGAWPGHARYDPFGPVPAPSPVWLRACTAALKSDLSDPCPDQGAGPVWAALRLRSPASAAPAPLGSSGRPLRDAIQAAEDFAAGGGPSVTTPAERVERFAAFVSLHSHFLQQQPDETVPLAWNSARGGPVAERAEPLAAARTTPWLARESRPEPPPARPVCLRQLRGHTGTIFGVALSADGRLAVSASEDQTLRVWDVASGACQSILTGHTGPVTTAALTPDGRFVLSASHDETLRLWHVGSGECVRVLQGHAGPVHAAALTDDAALAVSGGRDRSLRAWHLDSGKSVRLHDGRTGAVMALALTPDGRLAVSGDGNGRILLWDPFHMKSDNDPSGPGAAFRMLGFQFQAVCGLTLSPDGRTVVSVGADKKVRIWDTLADQPPLILSGHTDAVRGVALAPGPRLAFTGGWDGVLRVWDLENGRCLRTLPGTPTYGVALTPDGRLGASAGIDQTVRIWDFGGVVGEPRPAGHKGSVFNFAWTPNGELAATASKDGSLRVWQMATGRCVRVLTGHKSWVHGVAVTPDGRTVVSASWDGTVRVWDVTTAAEERILSGHTGEVRDVAVTADGRFAASASYDQTVRLWHLRTGECQHVLKSQGTELLSVDVSRDGRTVVAGDWDGGVHVWDMETACWMRVLRGHRAWVTSVALSPDGRRIASASKDRSVRVWDLAAGRELHILEGHTAEVLDVIWTPGGRVLSGSEDGTVRLWDVAGQRCLAVYYAGAPVRSVAALEGEGRFVCGMVNGQMHVLTARNL